MDAKSKLLFTLLVVLIIVSIGLTYYRSFVSKDFEIINTEEGEPSGVTLSDSTNTFSE